MVAWLHSSSVMTAVVIGVVAGISSSKNTIIVSAASSNPTFLGGGLARNPALLSIRGGTDAPATATATDDEPSLDDKVYAAMKKLGINPPGDDDDNNCQDGACAMPGAATETSTSTSTTSTVTDPHELSLSLAKEFDVDDRLTMAAIGATSSVGDQNQRVYNEEAARNLIQQELDLISRVDDNHPNVKQLVSEGYDPFMSRRALAFADENMEDARAILLAEKLDEEEAAQEEEEQAALAALRVEQQQTADQPKMDTVEVKANFDPTKLGGASPSQTPAAQPQTPGGMPKPAAKESVVFEATTAQIQELVLESPVPVLLDIYADWCGKF